MTDFPFTDVTCEGPRCPFSRLPALPSQLELCEQVFGLSTSSVVQAVGQTNSYYGGQTPGATQVLFINGEPGIGPCLLDPHLAGAQHTIVPFLTRGHRPLARAECNTSLGTLGVSPSHPRCLPLHGHGPGEALRLP